MKMKRRTTIKIMTLSYDDFFQRLASSCANREVRNLLMSVVEEMEKD